MDKIDFSHISFRAYSEPVEILNIVYLYGARAGGRTTSNLYLIDPETAELITIGPLGYAVTGLAWDGTTNTMYGATSPNSANNPSSLITVDLETGDGTLVGSFVDGSFGDIACDGSGYLVGYANGNATNNGLWSINKSTGEATWLGDATVDHYGGALAFDSEGILWSFDYFVNYPASSIITFDAYTGVPTYHGEAEPYATYKASTFNTQDVLFAIDDDDQLVTVPVPDGPHTVIGEFSVTNMDALEFALTGGIAEEPERPANDNFVNAVELVGTSGTIDATNANATVESGEDTDGYGNCSVWYKFTAPSNGTLYLETLAFGSPDIEDSVILAFTGATVSTTTLVGSNDDYTGTYSFLPLAVTSGVEYHISITGFNTSNQGGFTLDWVFS